MEEIKAVVGKSNEAFDSLLSSFLKTEILDREGKSYASTTRGEPQGSPLSPILMNIFLHRLDLRLTSFIQEKVGLGYVRYTDDMLIGIMKGTASEEIYQGFNQLFRDSLVELKLEATSSELFRARQEGAKKDLLVLGLLLSITSKGKMEIRAPINRWKRKLSLKKPKNARTIQPYRSPYPPYHDMLPYPPGYQIPPFSMFDGGPKRHLSHFITAYRDTATNGSLLLRQFPLSLDGPAYEWYDNLRPGSISSWKEMQRA